MNRAWAVLFAAGLCEVVWAVSMDYSDGFTVWYFDALVIVFLILSVILLSRAMKSGLPVGTAYAVWTGIGAVGTITVSVALGNEVLSILKAIFIIMIVCGIAGLELTASEE